MENIERDICLADIAREYRMEYTESQLAEVENVARIRGGVGFSVRTDIRSANYGPNAMMNPIKGIILHHTAGRRASDIPTLVNRGTGVSSNDYVTKDGTCFELVPHPRRAWHAGYPDAGRPYYTDANSAYWGMEIENLGNGSDPYPQAQIDTVVWRARQLRKRFPGIEAIEVFRHRDLAPSRKSDTSNNFPYDEVKRRAFAATDPTDGEVSPVEPDIRPAKEVYVVCRDGVYAERYARAFEAAMEGIGLPADRVETITAPSAIRDASYQARYGELGEYICVVAGTKVVQDLHADARAMLRDGDGKWYSPDISDLWDCTTEVATKFRWRITSIAQRHDLPARKGLARYEELIAS